MGVPYGLSKYDDGSRVKIYSRHVFRDNKDTNTRVEKLHDEEFDKNVVKTAVSPPPRGSRRRCRRVLNELFTICKTC